MHNKKILICLTAALDAACTTEHVVEPPGPENTDNLTGLEKFLRGESP